MSDTRTVRPGEVGKLNERHVLRVIQAAGAVSRADVVRRTGLSAPTVSKAVASLLAAGLLEPADAGEPSRGRPAPRLRLASEKVQVLGVVVDAGRCEVVAAGLDGVIARDTIASVPTPSTYPALLGALEKRCRRLMAKPGVATLGLGVSLPGLIDAGRGVGVLSPNVPVTNGRSPAADLGDRLGVPAVLVQESHALCLSERYHGLAVGMSDFAMLDASVGVGLGVVSGGRPVLGNSGFAGELGHLTVVPDGGRACGCGNTGCLETECSDTALAWRVGNRLGTRLTVEDAVAAATPQEVRANVRYLAVAAAAVVNVFNPATLFVHARLFDAAPEVFDEFVAETGRRALAPPFADCRVVRAKGNKRQGAVAAVVQSLTNAVAAGSAFP